MIWIERKIKNAVFFDRDGALIHDRGFITNPGKVVFYSRTFDALKMLQHKFALFIVSNQSGIAKGRQSFEETEEVNRHIIGELAARGIKIRGCYFCPHKRDDNCRCMKPKPYFAHKAAADHGISLAGSFAIGDHPHDVEFARNFGGRGVYILTGHGKKHRGEIRKNDFTAKNIFTAASFILRQPSFENKYCSAIAAAGVIKKGGVAIFPTETVYGLGCDAFNAQAAETVFKLKKRPRFDPLIVHISDIKQLSDVSRNISRQAMRLAEKFWPGPLTLILPKAKKIPDIVTAGLKTVAVRMPSHPVALKIIKESGCPLAAPSANIFGALSPTTVENAKSQFGDSVPCVVDGGPCEIGVESSIVDFSGAKARLLRPGGIPCDLLKEALGRLELQRNNSTRPLCPGTTPRHYAPETRLVLNTPGKSRMNYGKV